ncbi:MAG: hypothetical protein PHY79_23250 [Anaerolineae bacterium]|nr:hypothetical protein [Anaerolineae bacterium]
MSGDYYSLLLPLCVDMTVFKRVDHLLISPVRLSMSILIAYLKIARFGVLRFPGWVAIGYSRQTYRQYVIPFASAHPLLNIAMLSWSFTGVSEITTPHTHKTPA